MKCRNWSRSLHRPLSKSRVSRKWRQICNKLTLRLGSRRQSTKISYSMRLIPKHRLLKWGRSYFWQVSMSTMTLMTHKSWRQWIKYSRNLILILMRQLMKMSSFSQRRWWSKTFCSNKKPKSSSLKNVPGSSLLTQSILSDRKVSKKNTTPNKSNGSVASRTRSVWRLLRWSRWNSRLPTGIMISMSTIRASWLLLPANVYRLLSQIQPRN